MENSNHRLVVGVDFGTTYSGAAYLYLSEENPKYSDINVIGSWPGMGNKNVHKAPTEIGYEENKTLWGYQLSPGTKRYGCFKLLLDYKTKRAEYDDPGLSFDSVVDAGNPNALLALPPGKSAHDVTFEYLELFYKHIMEYLQKRVPRSFDTTPIHFVLTTPAIWSHEAQNLTLDAAKRAGFASRARDTIDMVAEPEAAALYSLREIYSTYQGSEDGLREGECILVCDAGGGTVDLVTYTVGQVTPTLHVREANVRSGGKCGSAAIDSAFLKWIESLIGEPFKNWPPNKTERGNILMVNFENAKRSFGTSSHDYRWFIPLGYVADDAEKNIADGVLILTGKDIQGIFDPVVNKIVSLVAQQIKDAYKTRRQDQRSTVILVGGLGQSNYLHTKLKEWCESQSPPVGLIYPMHPWSAVARGAVIHGIESRRNFGWGAPETENLVTSRKLTQHYGVFLAAVYDPEVHDKEDVYFEPLMGRKMSLDNVVWFAGKGQDAENEQRFPIPFCARFPEWQSRELTFELVGSEMEIAPSSAKRGNVKTIGQLSADLSSLPDSAFQVVGSTARGRIFTANITMNMKVASAGLTFEVIFEGESYGSCQFEY